MKVGVQRVSGSKEMITGVPFSVNTAEACVTVEYKKNDKRVRETCRWNIKTVFSVYKV